MMRPFTVNPVLNGFIVQIGCQTLVFPSSEALVEAIQAYLKDPGKTEVMYVTKSCNANRLTPKTTNPAANPVEGDLRRRRDQEAQAAEHYPRIGSNLVQAESYRRE